MNEGTGEWCQTICRRRLSSDETAHAVPVALCRTVPALGAAAAWQSEALFAQYPRLLRMTSSLVALPSAHLRPRERLVVSSVYPRPNELARR